MCENHPNSLLDVGNWKRNISRWNTWLNGRISVERVVESYLHATHILIVTIILNNGFSSLPPRPFLRQSPSSYSFNSLSRILHQFFWSCLSPPFSPLPPPLSYLLLPSPPLPSPSPPKKVSYTLFHIPNKRQCPTSTRTNLFVSPPPSRNSIFYLVYRRVTTSWSVLFLGMRWLFMGLGFEMDVCMYDWKGGGGEGEEERKGKVGGGGGGGGMEGREERRGMRIISLKWKKKREETEDSEKNNKDNT